VFRCLALSERLDFIGALWFHALARAKALSARRRKEIAQKAAATRWKT
jgi:hypothetical protein